MRRQLTAAAIVAVSLAFSHQSDAGGGAPPSAPSGGRVIDVSAFVAGNWGDPAGLWDNPCSEPFSQFVSERHTTDAGPSRGRTRVRADGVIEKLWVAYCEDPTTGRRDPENLQEFYIAAPTPADIVRAVYAYMPDYLDPPVVEWPNMNRENGWLFVKVPMDFRVNNLGPVTVTATANNSLGTSTGSVTATPDTITFDSGEGGSASCTAEQATAAYVHAVTDACEYTYQNSSAIAPDGYSFDSTTTMDWSIASTPTDPTIPATLDTFTSQKLPVSEVQSIVTCYGDNC